MQFSRPLRLSVLFTTIQGHSAVSVASNFRSLALIHDYFHAGPIVPAPVENDDFTGTREVLDKTLAVNLCLFPIRRSSQRHYPEHAGLTRWVMALITPPLPAASQLPLSPLQFWLAFHRAMIQRVSMGRYIEAPSYISPKYMEHD
jgi:hypothetical protein